MCTVLYQISGTGNLKKHVLYLALNKATDHHLSDKIVCVLKQTRLYVSLFTCLVHVVVIVSFLPLRNVRVLDSLFYLYALQHCIMSFMSLCIVTLSIFFAVFMYCNAVY